MTRVPIALIVDDGCPLVHVYREHQEHVHRRPPVTADGRPLVDTIPNFFLDRFCDVVERHAMAGKFSIVPSPAGKGDIVRGIAGHDPSLTREWLRTAARRLSSRFDFCPEGITHDLTLDLETGRLLGQGESDWSQTQDRRSLTPYLTRALELMKAAGFEATGVTSPWMFGAEVEEEYVASIMAAQEAVYGRSFSWYFLHMLHDEPRRPWVASRSAGSVIVSIPSTVDDFIWATIDTGRTDAAFRDGIADRIITRDGAGGAVIEVLRRDAWPVLLTHWQSLYSNGLQTGLEILDEVGRRIGQTLSDRVEWKTCTEMARMVA